MWIDGHTAPPQHRLLWSNPPTSLRQRRIERGGEPLAGAHDLREQLELAGGAAAFAFETRLRQTRFLVRPFDQRVAQRRDAVGDTLEKLGAHRERQLPVRIERLLRQLAEASA